jgi:hypothetical protein
VRQSERLASCVTMRLAPGRALIILPTNCQSPVRNVVYLQGLKGMLTLSKFLLSLQFKEGLESYERNILLSPY